MPLQPATTSKRGFSIIELLVVIGIIAILLAILVPMLAGVRQKADAINCTSNLRQIGVALHARAAERGGYGPLVGTIVVPASLQGSSILSAAVGDAARTKYDYVYLGSPLIGETVASFQMALSKQLGVKNPNTVGYVPPPELLSKWEVFTCARARPSHPASTTFMIEFEGVTSLNSMQLVPMHFVLNDAVFGYGAGRLAGKLSKIDNPTRTLILADGAPPGGSITMGDGTPRYWSPTSGAPRPLTLRDAFEENGRVVSQQRLFDPDRHKDRINLLFADGHVEAEPMTPEALETVIMANW